MNFSSDALSTFDTSALFTKEELRKRLSEIPPEQLAYRNLGTYITIMNPGYRFAKFMVAIHKKLMGVESGKIRRLIVSMPPRHSKTVTISEHFPAWYVGRNPDRQIIFSTYSYERASDVGRKVRNQLLDPLHSLIFPDCRLSPTAKGQNRFFTTMEGTYFAVGVNGVVTGRGANLLIIDDPIKNRETAESDTERRKLQDWFRAVAYERLQPDNAIIIVMTRWHYDDLAGFVQEEMDHQNWDVLELPAVCDSEDDPVGRNIGEALWETDYPIEVLEDIKKTVGTREWSSQFQQKPIIEGAGIVDINDFQRYDYKELAPIYGAIAMKGEIPPMPFGILRIVQSWDTAYKENQLNDPSACTIWGVTKNYDCYLLGIVNKRMTYPKLKNKVIQVWEKFMMFDVGPIPVIIEDAASGQSLIQELRPTAIPVVKARPDNQKRIRMSTASPMIEAHKVYLPHPDKASWVIDYETEMARFPYWRYDNLADSTSQFLKWIMKPKPKKSKSNRFWK